MQKKKSEAKLSLPAVGVKPTQTSKNYTSKNNIAKCREVEEKNIYFEMPSIHQNDLTLKTFIEEDRPLHKLQMRIFKAFQAAREGKLAEEWELYMKKSEIVGNRSPEFSQLEEYLTKTVYRLLLRASEIQQQNSSFSLNRSLRSSCNLDITEADPSRYNRTCIEDRVLTEAQSKIGRQSPNKTMLQTAAINLQGTLGQQNVLLQKRAELYERRIEELSRSLARFEEKENQGVGEKDNTSELMQAIAVKNKYKYESEVKSMHIESLTREAKAAKDQVGVLQQRLNILQAELRALEKQNLKCRQYLKYRELWQMATEQALGWQSNFRQQREEREKNAGKIKMLKEKNKQLLNYFNVSNAVNPDQEQDKQDLDKIIKEFKEWLMIISVPKVALSGEVQHVRAGEQLNIKLLRPNFYIFFEAFDSTLLMEKNIINIRPIQYNFFLKIRCIFDALYKHFLLASSYKDYPSFPEFIVGFLEKYQVNPQTGKVEFRRKPIENEEKITFLVNLFNKNFCNTWECEIFKQFLFENYYLDQIFFFLDCRNEFNSGTPVPNTLGSVDPISYVKLSKALKVVGKMLSPYENYIIQKVKSILRAKKKVKYGESFVDKHFVLKLLLQVYSLERGKSERVFQSSFTAKMRKSFITFGDCHHFLASNFNFLTSPQIAQLYRQLYTLSSGHVTHKALHYLCGSKGLFIPLLLEKRAARRGEKSLGGDMLLLDVQNVVTKIAGQLEEFGQQQFMGFEYSISSFMRQLDHFKTNKAAFYHRLLLEKCNVLRINTLLQLAASYQLSPGQIMEQSEVQTHMIQLHSLLHQTDTQVHLLARQKERRSKAWRMIVKNFKIRIQESILQFEKVNEEQIRKLREQIQTTNLNKEQALEQELKKEKSDPRIAA